MEKQLLMLAMEQDQLLTISEIVLYTEMDQKTAEQVLEELRKKGLVKIKVADNGVWVYEFEPLLTKEQKLSAERV
ncbi:ArsR family transcriptional regulator [Paenibacillus sp. GYB006]